MTLTLTWLWVIRRGHLQPDCLSVSFRYTKDQIVLGIPLGSPKTRYVPTGSQIARVQECASSGVLLYKILIESYINLVGLVVGPLLSKCLYSLFLCFIFQVKVEESWQATEKDRGMPYRDSVLLPRLCISVSVLYF